MVDAAVDRQTMSFSPGRVVEVGWAWGKVVGVKKAGRLVPMQTLGAY